MKNKGVISGLIVFIILIALCGGVICFALKNNSSTDNVSYSKKFEINTKQKNNYIASLFIEGEIGVQSRSYNQTWLLSTIEHLTEDEKNIALIVYINSPGGSVYQTDEVYLALKKYKNTGRPIYVYQGELAASGGYYISCAGTKIYANRNTLTGSIGVIAGQTFEITKLLDNLGIKSETIHAGKNKNMGNYNEPLSDEQRAILQSVADECYEQFTLIVSNDRNIPLEKVQEIADGRIYTAKQAQELKLVDKVTSWDSMVDDLRINELNNSDCKIVEFKVPQSNSIMDILNYAKTSIGNERTASSMGIPLSVAQKINAQRQYPAFIYEN